MQMLAPRILFYVQHLLGIGHLKRASLLNQALIESGFDVHIILGGEPSPIKFYGATLHQLPSIRCLNGDFSQLVDENNEPLNNGLRVVRRQQLLRLFDQLNPDILLIELYPFGRRQFRFELLPLLERATIETTCTQVVCSLRDILVKKTQEKLHRSQESAFLIKRYFNKVLVHADPSLVTLSDSFPYTDQISDKLLYTGYIGETLSTKIIPGSERHGVIVSAGGGAVGKHLLEVAISVKPLCALSDHPWLILTGPNLSETDFDILKLRAQDNGIQIERFRSDFIEILSRSSLSISQAGYNTTVELLSTQTPSLVIPFARDGETEQLQRSELFEQHGILTILKESELSSESLVKSINKAYRVAPSYKGISLNGAEESANQLKNLIENAKP